MSLHTIKVKVKIGLNLPIYLYLFIATYYEPNITLITGHNIMHNIIEQVCSHKITYAILFKIKVMRSRSMSLCGQMY